MIGRRLDRLFRSRGKTSSSVDDQLAITTRGGPQRHTAVSVHEREDRERERERERENECMYIYTRVCMCAYMYVYAGNNSCNTKLFN